jgi:hypothetical protein
MFKKLIAPALKDLFVQELEGCSFRRVADWA